MNKLLLAFVLLLTACSATLPSKSREISDFIPREKTEEIILADFTYAEKNFPKNCRWEELKRVVDGDTIHTTKNKIRMIGIDTPEIQSPYTDPERGGKEASTKLREILDGAEKVCLIHDRIGDTTDKYGRSLDYVFTEDGLDLNAEMVKTGHARWYSRFPYERKGEFKHYQQDAKDASLGLWE